MGMQLLKPRNGSLDAVLHAAAEKLIEAIFGLYQTNSSCQQKTEA
jgi:hypothetical protein